VKGDEKMVEKKKEVRIGNTGICLDEDNILHITSFGDIDEETAKTIFDACAEMAAPTAGIVDILIDLNHCGTVSAKARRFAKVSFEKDDTGKVALFGLHPVARVLASFVIGVTRKKDLRFFKTEEEALAWLKEKAPPLQ